MGRRDRRRRRAAPLLALLHGLLCSLPRVNDVATGIALMLLGTGLAFYLGKPLIQPQAHADRRRFALGGLERFVGRCRRRCQINALFPLGVALAVADRLGLRTNTLGPGGAHWRAIRATPPRRSATQSTASASRPPTAGGFIAGLGGASLSLYYPGSWNEGVVERARA